MNTLVIVGLNISPEGDMQDAIERGEVFKLAVQIKPWMEPGRHDKRRLLCSNGEQMREAARLMGKSLLMAPDTEIESLELPTQADELLQVIKKREEEIQVLFLVTDAEAAGSFCRYYCHKVQGQHMAIGSLEGGGAWILDFQLRAAIRLP